MPVRFFVPGPLRDFSGGQAQVEITGSPATLGDALAALGAMYPGVARRETEQRLPRPVGRAVVHEHDLVRVEWPERGGQTPVELVERSLFVEDRRDDGEHRAHSFTASPKSR